MGGAGAAAGRRSVSLWKQSRHFEDEATELCDRRGLLLFVWRTVVEALLLHTLRRPGWAPDIPLHATGPLGDVAAARLGVHLTQSSAR